MHGVQLERLFAHLDLYGSRRRTAEATIRLNNTECLTVRAGGGGVGSAPAGTTGPYTAYEVLLDHEPPRFWRAYSSQQYGVLYRGVPRLLVAHHIVRRGGIATIDYEVKEPASGVFSMQVEGTKDAGERLWKALQLVPDVRLIGSEFIAAE